MPNADFLNITYISRAELPELLYRLQSSVRSWAATIPEPGGSKLLSMLPSIDPRAVKTEILGAIDESLPVYDRFRKDLIKYKAYFENITTDDEPGHKLIKSVTDDVVMILMLNTVVLGHWLLQTYATVIARQMSPGAAREYVAERFGDLHLQELWKKSL